MKELSGRTRKRIVVGLGAFLVLAAIGMLLYAFLVVGEELARLEGLTPFEPAQGLRVGQPILVTTVIGDGNPLLVHDLVVACEETQDTDSRAWMPRKQIHGPLVVDCEGIEITVTLRQPCPRGRMSVIPDPESRMRRWVGLRRGDTLTVVGKVAGIDPLAVRGEDAFAGSADEYRRYLTRARWYVVPVSAIFLVAGLGLIASGARRRDG